MTAIARLVAVGLVVLTVAGSAEAAAVPVVVTSIRFTTATGITTTVIAPRAVSDLVQAVDALPRFVARPCPLPLYTPPDVRFEYLSGSGAVMLRALDHAPGTCAGEITIGRRHFAEASFVASVKHRIGVDIDPNPETAANQRFASQDAAHLLQLTISPPGSHRLKTAPKELAVPGVRLTAPQSHDRIWKVRMSVGAVFAFERAHRPRGSRITGNGLVNQRGKVSRQLTFSFPAIRNRVTTREIDMNIAPLGDGWTGASIGARVDWVLRPDPDAVVPHGVRTIEIRKGSALTHRVTSPRTVATIIRWFDALPVAPPAGPCGPFRAVPEVITFLDGSNRTLARAKAYAYGRGSNVCSPIRFFAGGRAFAPLLGGGFLIRVENLLR